MIVAIWRPRYGLTNRRLLDDAAVRLRDMLTAHAFLSTCQLRAKGDDLKALANEETLLPTQMFPRLPPRATFVADTNFVSRTQKIFLILFRNILCPQQMFPSLRSPRNTMGNNVSATMCPRLPAPLVRAICRRLGNRRT